MATFEHEVPEALRRKSFWDWDVACYFTPDGRAWVYTNDPTGDGAAWQEHPGRPIRVAVWIGKNDDSPFPPSRETRDERGAG